MGFKRFCFFAIIVIGTAFIIFKKPKKYDKDNDRRGLLTVTRCQVEWKIENYLVRSILNKNSLYMYSENFTLSNGQWRISVYPYLKPNTLWIRLERLSPSTKKHRVTTIVAIRKADGSVSVFIQEVLEFTSNKTESLRAGLIDRISLMSSDDIWMPDGKLTIMCTFSLKDSSVVDPTPILKSNDSLLVRNLEDLLRSGRKADVTIKVKEKEFKVHRTILIARSPVFETMLQKSGTVNIKEYDQGSFQDFLLYMYTGKMDHVTSDNAQALYKIADNYFAEELKMKCANFMSRRLVIDSFCDVFLLSTMQNEPELMQSATHFFINNMKEIIQTQKWINFQSMHSNLVNKLLLEAADYIKM